MHGWWRHRGGMDEGSMRVTQPLLSCALWLGSL